MSVATEEKPRLGYKYVSSCRESLMSAFCRGAPWPATFESCRMEVEDIGDTKHIGGSTYNTTRMRVNRIYITGANGEVIECYSARPGIFRSEPIVYRPGEIYETSKAEMADDHARFYYWADPFQVIRKERGYSSRDLPMNY